MTMDIADVLHNLPREALLEKACRLRQSVDDMLALWGDLQLERRTLRGEGRRLNQQVAKLAEDSKRVHRNDGLIGESLKHFGYGEVVDVIRGSIVERGTPSWTSGMVAAISASLGEAALQLLPNHDSLPNTGIAPPCHQRGKGRTGLLASSSRFASGERRRPASCRAAGESLTSKNTLTTEGKVKRSADQIMTRQCSLGFISKSESGSESSSESVNNNTFPIKSDNSDDHQSSRSTTISAHTLDTKLKRRSELTIAGSRPLSPYAVPTERDDSAQGSHVSLPQGTPPTELGIVADPFSQNLLRQGSQLLEGSRTLADRSEIIQGMVSEWMFSDDDKNLSTLESEPYTSARCASADSLASMEPSFNVELLEPVEQEVQLVDEEEGEIAIQIEDALGLQIDQPITRNRKRPSIFRSRFHGALAGQSFEFVMPVVKDKEDRKKIRSMDRKIRRKKNRSFVKAEDSYWENSDSITFEASAETTMDSRMQEDSQRLEHSKNLRREADVPESHQGEGRRDKVLGINMGHQEYSEDDEEQAILEKSATQSSVATSQSKSICTMSRSSSADGLLNKPIGTNNYHIKSDGSMTVSINPVMDVLPRSLSISRPSPVLPQPQLLRHTVECSIVSLDNIDDEKVKCEQSGEIGNEEDEGGKSKDEENEVAVNNEEGEVKYGDEKFKSEKDDLELITKGGREVISIAGVSQALLFPGLPQLVCLDTNLCLPHSMLQQERFALQTVGNHGDYVNLLLATSKLFPQKKPSLFINIDWMQTWSTITSDQNNEIGCHSQSALTTLGTSINPTRGRFPLPVPSQITSEKNFSSGVSVISPLIPTSNNNVVENSHTFERSSSIPLHGHFDNQLVPSFPRSSSAECALSEFVHCPTAFVSHSSDVRDCVHPAPVFLTPSSPHSSPSSSSTKKSFVVAKPERQSCTPKRAPAKLRSSRIVKLSIRSVDSHTIEISWTLDFRRLLQELIHLGRRQSGDDIQVKGTNSVTQSKTILYKTKGLGVALGVLPVYFAVVCDPCQSPDRKPQCLLSGPVNFSVSNKPLDTCIHVVSSTQLFGFSSVCDVIAYGSPSQITLVSDGLYASKKEEEWLRLGIETATAATGDFDLSEGNPLLPGGYPTLKAGMKIELVESGPSGLSIKQLSVFEPLHDLWHGSSLAQYKQCGAENESHTNIATREVQTTVANQLFAAACSSRRSSNELLRPEDHLTVVSKASESLPEKRQTPKLTFQSRQEARRMRRNIESGKTMASIGMQDSKLSIDASHQQLTPEPKNKTASCQSEPEISELIINRPVANFFDDLRRFDALGVTGAFTGERGLASALRKRLPHSESVASTETLEGVEKGSFPSTSASSGRPGKSSNRAGDDTASRPNPTQQEKNLSPPHIINRKLIKPESPSPSSSKKSSRGSPMFPSSLDVTDRMMRANDLHRRLISKVKLDGERCASVSGMSSSSIQIPRIGAHREIKLEDRSGHNHDTSSKHSHSHCLYSKSRFVIRIQIDDSSNYEELRFADDSDIHQVSRKFLLRHNIKSVFQWGLEKTANNFIAEVKCVSPPKVFHERLQSYVFLKTIDIVDVPID